MMPIAMVVGAIGYDWFEHLSFLMPYLIFLMLLFTFSKLSPEGIKFKKLHFILLSIQLIAGSLIYFFLYPQNEILAQGAMICIIAPTATAAAVITSLLGGDLKFITGFVLMSNLGVALLAPVLFSFGISGEEISFWNTFSVIFMKVFPLLFAPLTLAWIIRYTMPKVQNVMLRFSKAPFYFWSLSLTIATATTVAYMIRLENHNFYLEASMAIVSLVICSLQFFVGKRLGSIYGNRIAAGQSLGQKNTILAIWMSQVFLNPVTALAPATYILWQNIINSYQLWKKSRKDEAQKSVVSA